jgi:signal transduction histidine kinase/ActR/RegA family two-component response regulator
MKNGPNSAQQKKRHVHLGHWPWVAVAVLALGVASIALLIGNDRIHERLVARDLMLVCAIGEMESNVAKAHLWMKEYVSGDDANGDEIWASFDAAKRGIDAVQHGGVIHENLKIPVPLTAPELRDQALRISDDIGRLEKMSRERLKAYEASEEVGIGSPMDMEQDDIFFGFSERSSQLEMAIVELVAKNQRQARLIFQTILTAWIVIVAMAVTGLWTRESKRRLAETALTEREAQLLQAQKMEAVGRLAGGIAHDINNYLAAIIAQAELVRMKADVGSPTVQKMDSVIATAGKASGLIKRLLAFSRRQPVHPAVVDLNEVVEGLRKVVVRLLGERIWLELDLDENLGNVKIDPAQLEQVVVNLLVNAGDAMPEGGTVTVRTRNLVADEFFLDSHPTAEEGEYVLLEVSDVGTGVAPEIRDKLFEPFFTTKEEAGRSGLGLATVYGIVRQNRGIISLESTLGEGTTFRIHLPRTREEARVAAGQPEETESLDGHQEKILLVEDNDDLRISTQGVLEAIGYRVTAAANGQEAIALCENGASDVDLLITDVVMPGMSGREVMDRVRRIRADVSVLFISGYTDNVILRHGIREGEFEFLQKPFSTQKLARKIRQVLESSPHGGGPVRHHV